MPDFELSRGAHRDRLILAPAGNRVAPDAGHFVLVFVTAGGPPKGEVVWTGRHYAAAMDAAAPYIAAGAQIVDEANAREGAAYG